MPNYLGKSNSALNRRQYSRVTMVRALAEKAINEVNFREKNKKVPAVYIEPSPWPSVVAIRYTQKIPYSAQKELVDILSDVLNPNVRIEKVRAARNSLGDKDFGGIILNVGYWH